jgi:hypothetical protein
VNVLELAQTLAARARTYADDQSQRDERDQVALTLLQLEAKVSDLKTSVEAFQQALIDVPELTPIDAERLKGPEQLKARVDQGLPSPQALRGARDRMTKLRTEVDAAVDGSWRPWAKERLADAQVGRVRMLRSAYRATASNTLRRMISATTATPLTASSIGQFRRDLLDLAKMLESIKDDDPVVQLLNKIRRADLTLGDLSDGELAQLRADPNAAAQVLLRM